MRVEVTRVNEIFREERHTERQEQGANIIATRGAKNARAEVVREI